MTLQAGCLRGGKKLNKVKNKEEEKKIDIINKLYERRFPGLFFKKETIRPHPCSWPQSFQ
jgi:hypothetical protein